LIGPRRTRPSIRSEAMWLARHWEEVITFYAEEATTHDHNPHNVHNACRKAGLEWAMKKEVHPKVLAERQIKRPRAGARWDNTRGWRISEREYDLIVECLRPDLAPPDRRQAFTRAYGIFQRLGSHIILPTQGAPDGQGTETDPDHAGAGAEVAQ
jgi:hypothetical protein